MKNNLSYALFRLESKIELIEYGIAAFCGIDEFLNRSFFKCVNDGIDLLGHIWTLQCLSACLPYLLEGIDIVWISFHIILAHL